MSHCSEHVLSTGYSCESQLANRLRLQLEGLTRSTYIATKVLTMPRSGKCAIHDGSAEQWVGIMSAVRIGGQKKLWILRLLYCCG